MDGRFEADKLASVVEEDLAVAGEVIRFQGGCVEGGSESRRRLSWAMRASR